MYLRVHKSQSQITSSIKSLVASSVKSLVTLSDMTWLNDVNSDVSCWEKLFESLIDINHYYFNAFAFWLFEIQKVVYVNYFLEIHLTNTQFILSSLYSCLSRPRGQILSILLFQNREWRRRNGDDFCGKNQEC